MIVSNLFFLKRFEMKNVTLPRRMWNFVRDCVIYSILFLEKSKYQKNDEMLQLNVKRKILINPYT